MFDIVLCLVFVELCPNITWRHAEVPYAVSVDHFTPACAATPANAQVMHCISYSHIRRFAHVSSKSMTAYVGSYFADADAMALMLCRRPAATRCAAGEPSTSGREAHCADKSTSRRTVLAGVATSLALVVSLIR